MFRFTGKKDKKKKKKKDDDDDDDEERKQQVPRMYVDFKGETTASWFKICITKRQNLCTACAL